MNKEAFAADVELIKTSMKAIEAKLLGGADGKTVAKELAALGKKLNELKNKYRMLIPN